MFSYMVKPTSSSMVKHSLHSSIPGKTQVPIHGKIFFLLQLRFRVISCQTVTLNSPQPSFLEPAEGKFNLRRKNIHSMENSTSCSEHIRSRGSPLMNHSVITAASSGRGLVTQGRSASWSWYTEVGLGPFNQVGLTGDRQRQCSQLQNVVTAS